MKKLTILLFFCFGTLLHAQQTQIAVQSGHNDIITQVKLDEKRNLMITYGSFSDKTVKFWDRNDGTLLKTADIPEHARSMDVDLINGRTYLATKNVLIIYDNNTLTEWKRIEVKDLNTVVFDDKQLKLICNVGFEGNTSLKVIDPNTGVISNTQGQPWPSQGKAMRAKYVANDQFIQFETEFLETFLYSVEAGQYGQIESPPLIFFENADMLFAEYIDLTHIKLIRFNGYTGENVWEKVLVIEKLDRMTKAHQGQFALTPDGKGLWVAPAQSTLIELNPANGAVKGVIYTKNKKNNIVADNTFVYALEKDNDNLFSKGNYFKYGRYNEQPLARFGYKNFTANEFNSVNVDNKLLLLLGDLDGGVASFEADASNSRMTPYNINFTEKYSLGGDLYGSPDSREFYFAVRNEKEGLKRLKLGDANTSETMLTFPRQSSFLRVDPKNKHLVYSTRNSIGVMNIDNGTSIYQTIINGNSIVNYDFYFAADGRGLLMKLNDEIIPEAEYKRRIEYHDIISKRVLWKRDYSYSTVQFINDGDQILGLNIDSQKAEIINAADGSLIRSFEIGAIDFTTDGYVNPSSDRLLIVENEKGSKVFDLQGKLLNENDNFNELIFVKLNFVNDNYYAVSADGSTKFYDLKDGKEVLRLYMFVDGEWIAHTPNGLFDGSQNAWDRLVFARGREAIPLDRLFDQFYTPRLIYKVLYGGTIERPEVDIDRLKKAPTVKINYQEGTRNLTVEDDSEVIQTENGSGRITINANGNGDIISEIRLFHNGKRFSNTTRNLTVEDDVPGGNSKQFDVSLLEGENIFEAVALNSQNTESAPASVSVIYKKPGSSTPEVKGIQVHILAIGIDSYKNPKYNLNYAVADASGFKDAVSSGMTPITTRVHTYEVRNDQAIRDNILKKLNEISEKARPQDIFLFYYAGHGVVTQDAAKEFFLVPYDVTQLYGAEESLRKKGISANELKSIASGIAAQKQLYILDACQSAGALNAVASRGVAEEKAIAQLARSTGTHWLTASGSEQYATEFDELGHGVFTYALLEALNGKADSGDNRITVNELKAYLESRVPEISEKYRGSPQYPSSFGFGQDFPVAVYRN